MTTPLYKQVADQLNRYANTRFSPAAIADVLATVGQSLLKDHPAAGRHLMVEADIAQRDDADLLTSNA